jgi:hypothetical protein
LLEDYQERILEHVCGPPPAPVGSRSPRAVRVPACGAERGFRRRGHRSRPRRLLTRLGRMDLALAQVACPCGRRFAPLLQLLGVEPGSQISPARGVECNVVCAVVGRDTTGRRPRAAIELVGTSGEPWERLAAAIRAPNRVRDRHHRWRQRDREPARPDAARGAPSALHLPHPPQHASAALAGRVAFKDRDVLADRPCPDPCRSHTHGEPSGARGVDHVGRGPRLHLCRAASSSRRARGCRHGRPCAAPEGPGGWRAGSVPTTQPACRNGPCGRSTVGSIPPATGGSSRGSFDGEPDPRASVPSPSVACAAAGCRHGQGVGRTPGSTE